jgi:hypothetical protein
METKRMSTYVQDTETKYEITSQDKKFELKLQPSGDIHIEFAHMSGAYTPLVELGKAIQNTTLIGFAYADLDELHPSPIRVIDNVPHIAFAAIGRSLQ